MGLSILSIFAKVDYSSVVGELSAALSMFSLVCELPGQLQIITETVCVTSKKMFQALPVWEERQRGSEGDEGLPEGVHTPQQGGPLFGTPALSLVESVKTVSTNDSEGAVTWA